MIRKLFQFLYNAYVLIIFSVFVPLVLFFYLCINWLPDKKRMLIIYRIHRWWIGSWEMLTRIQFTLRGHEHIDPNKTYIFVCNHCNLLDILIVGSYIQHYWKPLVKKAFINFPVMGWLFRAISIDVDRSNPESRIKSVAKMMKSLNNGLSIMIFPEGTRNRTKLPLSEFHPGAFKLSIRSQIDIIPIVLTETRFLQPVNTLNFFPGKGYITILPAVNVAHFDEHSLKAHVHQLMYDEIVNLDPAFQNFGERPVMSGHTSK